MSSNRSLSSYYHHQQRQRRFTLCSKIRVILVSIAILLCLSYQLGILVEDDLLMIAPLEFILPLLLSSSTSSYDDVSSSSASYVSSSTTSTTLTAAAILAAMSSRSDNMQQQQQQKPTIPYRLSFNYHTNLLIDNYQTVFAGNEKELAYNVNRTIRLFLETWNYILTFQQQQSNNNNNNDNNNNTNSSSSVPMMIANNKPTVVFHNNQDCERIIQQTEPRLLHAFRNESGQHKSDICRIIDLYNHGGYYLDNDVGVIQVPIFPSHVSFITVLEENDSFRFFQAFLACSPQHPIIEETIDVMVDYYEGKLDPTTTPFYHTHNMGTWTLRIAYNRILEQNPFISDHIWLLQEVNLQKLPHLFPHIPRDTNWHHWNMAVIDERSHQIYFWARMGKDFRLREGYYFH